MPITLCMCRCLGVDLKKVKLKLLRFTKSIKENPKQIVTLQISPGIFLIWTKESDQRKLFLLCVGDRRKAKSVLRECNTLPEVDSLRKKGIILDGVSTMSVVDITQGADGDMIQPSSS